jgi:hypothetical protein
MENEFGHKSMDQRCPCCDSEGEIRGIHSNPKLEIDCCGNLKKHLLLRECVSCFVKFWHHIPESGYLYYKTLLEKRRNKCI